MLLLIEVVGAYPSSSQKSTQRVYIMLQYYSKFYVMKGHERSKTPMLSVFGISRGFRRDYFGTLAQHQQ
jgi:hypothetical protein